MTNFVYDFRHFAQVKNISLKIRTIYTTALEYSMTRTIYALTVSYSDAINPKIFYVKTILNLLERYKNTNTFLR